MEKKTGIHFYISIVNYNSIIKDDERKDGKVNHFIHALDTFFSSIEYFGKKNYSESFVIEKITGARLHMYVVGTSVDALFQTIVDVSVYAYNLAQRINHDIGKYRNLIDFQINVGASFGKFYEFEFQSLFDDKYSELTTIGYVANIAAKIQSKTSVSSIGIDKSIFAELCDKNKSVFGYNQDPTFQKYDLSGYYSASLKSFSSKVEILQEDYDYAISYANKKNISDVEPREPSSKLSFDSLAVANSVMINGIPLFCDVRGFTSQFNKDDSNLGEMAEITRKILSSMYDVVIHNGGIHVQFQGDREFSIFHNYSNTTESKKCFKDAVLSAMRLIDVVKPYSVRVGVGEAFGTMFATRIGTRGKKDNIVLGQTVLDADMLEDQHAGEDQIAVTADVYNGLKAEDERLAKIFRKEGSFFITSIGFDKYKSDFSFQVLANNNEKKNYNPAWGTFLYSCKHE